jgi:hypothetical protein
VAAGPPLQGLPPSHTRPPRSTAGNISSAGCLKTGPQYNVIPQRDCSAGSQRSHYVDVRSDRVSLTSQRETFRVGGRIVSAVPTHRADSGHQRYLVEPRLEPGLRQGARAGTNRLDAAGPQFGILWRQGALYARTNRQSLSHRTEPNRM